MDDGAWMFLEQEARALLTRLLRIKPFALSETMVPAANLSRAAQLAIDCFLAKRRSELRAETLAFIHELRQTRDFDSAANAQRRFTLLRLRFTTAVTEFDMFADALSQRSGHERGVWLAGLDALARDALNLPEYYEAPPVVCYLDCGVGAAIRRARTRLPGGGENPVAVIRVPFERLIGSAIAPSVGHEAGHQALALLDLVTSLRAALRKRGTESGPWRYWERWISEIGADLWSVSKLGVLAPLGLMGVLSLPRPFVVRISTRDPHPPPWLRVKLSCAIGHALYPAAQWQRLSELWDALYPLCAADGPVLSDLQEALPEFVEMLLEHRPASLRGSSISEVVRNPALTPRRLSAQYESFLTDPATLGNAEPCLACAVLGQARADGKLDSETESELMRGLLIRWALQATFVPNSDRPRLSSRSAGLPTLHL